MKGGLRAALCPQKMALWSVSGSFSLCVGLQFLWCAERVEKALKAGGVELPVLVMFPGHTA